MVGSQGPRTISYRKPHWNNKEGRRNPIILYNWLCGRGDAFLHNTTAKTTRDATSSPGRRWHKQRQTMWTHAHLTRARSRLKHPRLAVGSRDRQATHPEGRRPVQG